jgi:hypothetical protein
MMSLHDKNKAMAEVKEEVQNRRTFTYSPLDPGTTQIRIIELLPANDKAASIEVRIVHTTLDEIPGLYFALSYTWGDPLDTVHILANGDDFKVTRNLESALRYLRLDSKALPIWVDSICINQEDNSERSQQVLLMQRIYSKAYTTTAWIGDPDDRTAKAFKLIHDIATRLSLHDKMVINDDTKAWICEAVANKDIYSWDGVLDLMRRPYWSRAWIVQEIAVSENVNVCCGDQKLPYEFFMLLQGAAFGYLSAITQVMVQQYIENLRATGQQLDVEALMAFANDSMPDGFKLILQIIIARHYSKNDQFDTFYDIVRMFRSAEATDLRDKIYAFLGLATERHMEIKAIKPDYDMELGTLYRQFIRAHADTYNRVDFLWDACGVDRPQGFASWLPHYGRALQISEMRFEEVPGHITFRAASDVPPVFEFADCDRILKVKGVVIGNIDKLGDPLLIRPGMPVDDGFRGPDSITSTMSRWAALADAADTIAILRREQTPAGGSITAGSSSSNIMSPEDVKNALDSVDPNAPLMAIVKADGAISKDNQHVFIKDQRPDDEVMIIEPIAKYVDGSPIKQAFTRTTVKNPSASLDIEYIDPRSPTHNRARGVELVPSSGVFGFSGSHQNRRIDVCRGRRFFVTDNKYMGIAVPDTKDGDVVAVVLGAKVPLVLRRHNSNFLVVGEAYVHGLMEGETIQMIKEGKLKEELLCLE